MFHFFRFAIPIKKLDQGSGKSTIMQLMLRFYDPSSGQITVGGNDLANLDVSWWRKNVGFVAQEPVLFNMSVEENIRYGTPEATQGDVLDAAGRVQTQILNSNIM